MSCFLLAVLLLATPAGLLFGQVNPIADDLFNEDGRFISKNRQKNHLEAASVYTISGEELISNRSATLMEALQGRLPGLRILQTSATPGNENFTSHIRGFDTPSSSPVLFIVDGVQRDIYGMNVHDVASVTVLRDAAATSIYGMRGAGGVVLIETKKGYIGKSTINVTYDQAFQSASRLPGFVSAYDYARMYNQRQANDTLYADMQDIALGGSGIDHGAVPFYSPWEIERYQRGDMQEFYPVRNMVDEFVKDFAPLSRVNVNFRGGTSSMRYFTSVGFQTQDGLFTTVPFERYSYDASSKSNRFNFTTNLNVNLNPTLDVWININGNLSTINEPYFGGNLSWSNAIAKLYETPNNAHNNLTPDGEVLVKRDRINFNSNQSIFGLMNRTGSNNEKVTKLGNSFGMRQQLERILPGLSVSGQMAFDIFSTSSLRRNRSYQAFEVATFTSSAGQDSLGYLAVPGTSNTGLNEGEQRFFSYLYDIKFSLDYQQVFRGNNSMKASLIAERYYRQLQDFLPQHFLGMAGRVSYAHKGRYLANASFSYQGSEQYAEGHRFGLFPALALGWILSEEDFLAESMVVNFLKIRASVGQTGNTGLVYGTNDQYLYLSRWTGNATESQIGNENFTWETMTKYNVALEAELFHSIFLGADFFYTKTTDVIIREIAPMPTYFFGVGDALLPPANLGEVENRGVEFVGGYNKRFNKDFTLNISGNVSISKNNQIFMNEFPYDATYAYPYRNQGYPINNYWGYKADGLFRNQQEIDNWADQSALGGYPIPGDIKYLDLNNDGVIDEKDRAPLGNGQQPEIVYGVRNRISYKWFDLNVFVTGAGQRMVYLNNYGRWSNRDNFTEYMMNNAWSEERASSGESIAFPRLGRSSTNHILSDFWIENGSFIRLRNIELGFTLPQHLTNRMGGGVIRLYANGYNLLVWDKLPNKDFDPETAASQNNQYPLQKSFIVGASITF